MLCCSFPKKQATTIFALTLQTVLIRRKFVVAKSLRKVCPDAFSAFKAKAITIHSLHTTLDGRQSVIVRCLPKTPSEKNSTTLVTNTQHELHPQPLHIGCILGMTNSRNCALIDSPPDPKAVSECASGSPCRAECLKHFAPSTSSLSMHHPLIRHHLSMCRPFAQSSFAFRWMYPTISFSFASTPCPYNRQRPQSVSPEWWRF